ncbi:hypothetical protein AK812_SmicGene34402 [Symbiodinium microadriaticum]|uniref:Uncharacterized protein n=1 Tax=Symbiodinium microadriaticum TaxID=2951 RepID=A0A1Q9CP75_SYMMI|nr:hypothetical protein AK812_SmicGene34402 [Symbiodinium microadriaticum]
MGIVMGGFLLAFLNAICSAVTYGFFLGYMGLDSHVLSSITELMKLPHVLVLPFGILTDCCPIQGTHRKSYFVASWCLAGSALFALALRPLPAPFYCQNEDGSYNFMVPPCNPSIHTEKNWYVFWMFFLTAGIQLGIVAGEGLLLEYSQREPVECRGHIKAEMTMVSIGGALAASLVVGIFMNSKPYLGTFDWGFSFSGLMAFCFVLDDAQRQKKASGSSLVRATFVIGIPAICLIYGIIVLLLTSQEETACLKWIGGHGC